MANAPGNGGMREGLEALNELAHSPATAHFISWKIAQRFVADDPPEALVEKMAKTFLANDSGDIKQRCCGRWPRARSSTRPNISATR